MTITLPDSPLPDEIAVIICVANRGRLNARVGGLTFEDMQGMRRPGVRLLGVEVAQRFSATRLRTCRGSKPAPTFLSWDRACSRP